MNTDKLSKTLYCNEFDFRHVVASELNKLDFSKFVFVDISFNSFSSEAYNIGIFYKTLKEYSDLYNYLLGKQLFDNSDDSCRLTKVVLRNTNKYKSYDFSYIEKYIVDYLRRKNGCSAILTDNTLMHTSLLLIPTSYVEDMQIVHYCENFVRYELKLKEGMMENNEKKCLPYFSAIDFNDIIALAKKIGREDAALELMM